MTPDAATLALLDKLAAQPMTPAGRYHFEEMARAQGWKPPAERAR